MNFAFLKRLISRRYARSKLGTGADAVNGKGAQPPDNDEEVEKPRGCVVSPVPLPTERIRTVGDLYLEHARSDIAELKANIQRLEAELEALERTPAVRRARERRRILYLPSGRMRTVPGELPVMDFVVNDRMAGLLNIFAVTIFDDGYVPYLDLMHQREKKVFEISHFKFEPEGIFAHGSYTELGKQLRDSHRICGVSISTQVAPWNKPVNAAFDVEIPVEDTAHLEGVLSTAENLANMGGVLIDGATSAIQPFSPPVRTVL